MAKELDKPAKTSAGDIRNIIINEIKIAMTKFQVWFIFVSKDQKLKQLTLGSLNSLDATGTFSSIEKRLTEKYGAPTYKQEGQDVSWILPKTAIELIYVNFPSIWVQVLVVYRPAWANADASKNL